MKEYNVDKKIKKLSKPEGWAIVLIILGVILLFLEKWTAVHSFRDIGKILDSLLFPVIGIGILLNSSKQIKKIRGSYIKLEEDKFSFKSRSIEKEFYNLAEIKNVKINLETISIAENSNNAYTIFLDDYIGDNEQKEIKQYFKEVNEKIKAYNSK